MDKMTALRANIKQYDKLCVGFSGGVDSTFLLKVAVDVLGANVFCIIADGLMLPRRELVSAQHMASDMGVTCHVLPLDVLAVEAFAGNHQDRCYHCKKMIFSGILEKATALGATAIADGKNADDALGYRPGHKAAAELHVVSPLFEVGYTKAEIREASKELGLPTWNKPANACLATRLPINTKVDKAILAKVEAIEYLFEDKGMAGTRGRIHGDWLRIEMPKNHFAQMVHADELVAQLKQFGFKFVTLDLEGFRSGSMEEGV